MNWLNSPMKSKLWKALISTLISIIPWDLVNWYSFFQMVFLFNITKMHAFSTVSCLSKAQCSNAAVLSIYICFFKYTSFEIYCTSNWYYVESGQLICHTNPLTGFYIIRILGARYFRMDFRYGYHRKCYQKYTHKKELQRFAKKSEIEEAENRKSSRNSSFSGLICNRLHFLILDCCQMELKSMFEIIWYYTMFEVWDYTCGWVEVTFRSLLWWMS